MNIADQIASMLEILMLIPVLSMAYSEHRPSRGSSLFLAICLAGLSACLVMMDAPRTSIATAMSATLWGYLAMTGPTPKIGHGTGKD